MISTQRHEVKVLIRSTRAATPNVVRVTRRLRTTRHARLLADFGEERGIAMAAGFGDGSHFFPESQRNNERRTSVWVATLPSTHEPQTMNLWRPIRPPSGDSEKFIHAYIHELGISLLSVFRIEPHLSQVHSNVLLTPNINPPDA